MFLNFSLTKVLLLLVSLNCLACDGSTDGFKSESFFRLDNLENGHTLSLDKYTLNYCFDKKDWFSPDHFNRENYWYSSYFRRPYNGDSKSIFFSEQTFIIKEGSDSLCLEILNDNSLRTAKCTYSERQQLTIKFKDGYYEIRSKSNKRPLRGFNEENFGKDELNDNTKWWIFKLNSTSVSKWYRIQNFGSSLHLSAEYPIKDNEKVYVSKYSVEDSINACPQRWNIYGLKSVIPISSMVENKISSLKNVRIENAHFNHCIEYFTLNYEYTSSFCSFSTEEQYLEINLKDGAYDISPMYGPDSLKKSAYNRYFSPLYWKNLQNLSILKEGDFYLMQDFYSGKRFEIILDIYYEFSYRRFPSLENSQRWTINSFEFSEKFNSLLSNEKLSCSTYILKDYLSPKWFVEYWSYCYNEPCFFYLKNRKTGLFLEHYGDSDYQVRMSHFKYNSDTFKWMITFRNGFYEIRSKWNNKFIDQISGLF